MSSMVPRELIAGSGTEQVEDEVEEEEDEEENDQVGMAAEEAAAGGQPTEAVASGAESVDDGVQLEHRMHHARAAWGIARGVMQDVADGLALVDCAAQ